MRIAERARPELAHLMRFADAQAIRNEIARVVPAYDGIQHLKEAGDQVQWGGERLCEAHAEDGRKVTRFPTEDGKARFSLIAISSDLPEHEFRLSTRRGKQFNSIVHRDYDPLTGTKRDDVLINEADARRLGLANGDGVVLRNSVGRMEGRCLIAPIAAGNVQVHWPEGNVLIERGISDPECGIPDFNTTVEIERVV